MVWHKLTLHTLTGLELTWHQLTGHELTVLKPSLLELTLHELIEHGLTVPELRVKCLCRMDATFATISIIMSCVWLNLVASEVVALLQTFGMILNAPTVCQIIHS